MATPSNAITTSLIVQTININIITKEVKTNVITISLVKINRHQMKHKDKNKHIKLTIPERTVDFD